MAARAGHTDRSVSLELRWFGPGPAPAVVGAVLAGGRDQRRLDRYADLGRDDVGIKIRGRSRVGLKQRRGLVPVRDGLPPAERWARRSARRAPARTDPRFTWVTLAKRRTRVFVDLSGPEPVPCRGRRTTLARGGALELVDLEVVGRGTRLWSVAAESWGPGDREGLQRLLDWSGVDWTVVDAGAWLAAGYPALLRRLGDGGSGSLGWSGPGGLDRTG